jgi:hypothetical protein
MNLRATLLPAVTGLRASSCRREDPSLRVTSVLGVQLLLVGLLKSGVASSKRASTPQGPLAGGFPSAFLARYSPVIEPVSVLDSLLYSLSKKK